MRLNMPNTPPRSIRRYLYKTSPKSRVFRFALPLTALAAALLLFVVSFAPQQASAQQDITPTGVDAWIDYTSSSGLVAMRIDFDFNETTNANGDRIVKIYRIDTRYRRDSNSNFSDWLTYVGYTNAGHFCPVNVNNPNNDPEVTRRNRECAIATIWPNRGPGEYEVRIVAVGLDGNEASVTIQSKGIEPKPGKATITSTTGNADPNDATKGAFEIRWSHIATAGSYKVQYVPKAIGSFGDSTVVGEKVYQHGTHFAGINSLEPKTEYLVRIIVVGQFGREGDPTAAVSVRTGGGGTTPTITTPTEPDVDALVTRYDTNPTDGVISLAEANNAVAGQVAGVITAAELYALLDFYFNQSN